jgi:hypothetical protein
MRVPITEQAAELLKSFGLPKAQQNERSALTLLALAKLARGRGGKPLNVPFSAP